MYRQRKNIGIKRDRAGRLYRYCKPKGWWGSAEILYYFLGYWQKSIANSAGGGKMGGNCLQSSLPQIFTQLKVSNPISAPIRKQNSLICTHYHLNRNVSIYPLDDNDYYSSVASIVFHWNLTKVLCWIPPWNLHWVRHTCKVIKSHFHVDLCTHSGSL